MTSALYQNDASGIYLFVSDVAREKDIYDSCLCLFCVFNSI
jgi:hypothetical protein